MNPVDVYINQFPEIVKETLQQIRQIVKTIAPNAEEIISYGMPGYKTNGKPLIYFAGYKNHIGLYATPSGNIGFKNELSQYKQGRGSVQFPLDQPIPYELIQRIVKFRLEENESKMKK
ncbi:MAG TPA: DUF1801 domain-containing protein [Gelidibacter sp.]|uniref:iron chaperone n=1 Tax=Gelidibacter sp. TaxID=2018083 RepID=UPI002B863BA4|nr:DUF1801 domain-containing protein [Gelidibacter sp.]HXJ99059.1 DUF1801 domain-containing protein [Gelidibacter sp.]